MVIVRYDDPNFSDKCQTPFIMITPREFMNPFLMQDTAYSLSLKKFDWGFDPLGVRFTLVTKWRGNE